LTYRPALDGLRALAVVAVFAYHTHLPWARAGFLGVDVFFVLSGYLITALLLVEYEREGRIDLIRFWCRRARRLLPALIAVLAVVAVAVPLLAPEQAHRLRADLLAALGYVSNWRLIFENQSYFAAAGRPPVLQHLWSLAVEEQFYLLWPVVMAWALRRKAGLRGLNARFSLRDPNAESGLPGPNAKSGLRGLNARSGLRDPNAKPSIPAASSCRCWGSRPAPPC
jgi:peptidoglycan/LPS O-acetylase OafA/YrhL